MYFFQPKRLLWRFPKNFLCHMKWKQIINKSNKLIFMQTNYKFIKLHFIHCGSRCSWGPTPPALREMHSLKWSDETIGVATGWYMLQLGNTVLNCLMVTLCKAVYQLDHNFTNKTKKQNY